MKFPYVTVSNKKIVFLGFNEEDQEESLIFDVADIEGMQAYAKKHGVRSVQCSSSVDWPSDGGLSDDLDVRAILREVLGGWKTDDGEGGEDVARVSELLEILKKVLKENGDIQIRYSDKACPLRHVATIEVEGEIYLSLT